MTFLRKKCALVVLNCYKKHFQSVDLNVVSHNTSVLSFESENVKHLFFYTNFDLSIGR